MKKMTKEEKKKFLSDCEVKWFQLFDGIMLYTCWHKEWRGPIGWVWGHTLSSNSFYVCGSYVVQYVRRMGVRSLINKEILEWCPIIVTGQGSDTGGKQFMLASGYKYDKLRDQWFLVKKGYKPKPSDQNSKILAEAKGVGKGKSKGTKRKSKRH